MVGNMIIAVIGLLGFGQVAALFALVAVSRRNARERGLSRAARARLAQSRREVRERRRARRRGVLRGALVIPKAVVILLVVLPATAVVALGSWVRRIVVKGVGALVWWVEEEWTTVEIVRARIRRSSAPAVSAAPVAAPAAPAAPWWAQFQQ